MRNLQLLLTGVEIVPGSVCERSEDDVGRSGVDERCHRPGDRPAIQRQEGSKEGQMIDILELIKLHCLVLLANM